EAPSAHRPEARPELPARRGARSCPPGDAPAVARPEVGPQLPARRWAGRRVRLERGGQLSSQQPAAPATSAGNLCSANGFPKPVAELPPLDALDERGHRRLRVGQRRAFRVPRVPDGELGAAQLGQFHAGTLRIAGTALAPAGTPEFGSRHSVVMLHSSMASSSIPLKISIVRSGDSPSTLRRSITSVYFSTSSRLSR